MSGAQETTFPFSQASLKQRFIGKCGKNLASRYGFHSNLPKSHGANAMGMLSPVNWLRMAVDLARTPHFDACREGERRNHASLP